MKKGSKKESKEKLKDENKKVEDKKESNKVVNENKDNKKNNNVNENKTGLKNLDDIKLTLSSWRIKNSIPKGIMKSFLSKNKLDGSKKYNESELNKKYKEFLKSSIKED